MAILQFLFGQTGLSQTIAVVTRGAFDSVLSFGLAEFVQLDLGRGLAYLVISFCHAACLEFLFIARWEQASR